MATQMNYIYPEVKAIQIISDSDHFKSECDRRKDRKTKYGCEQCEVPICLEHAYFFCKNCADLNQLGSLED